MKFIRKQSSDSIGIRGTRGITVDANNNIIFESQSALLVPKGPSWERPEESEAGMIRYNETVEAFEFYTSAGWTSALTIGGGGGTYLEISKDLSDLNSASIARTNLGLGTAATQAATSFLAVSNNLSDLNSASTARTNLGLGTAATQASTVFLQVSDNLSDLNNVSTARTNLGLVAGGTGDIWLEKAGDTMTGTITVTLSTPTDPEIILNSVAGNSRFISFRTSGSTRWNVGASSAAESGSDAGSDFFINAHNDSATLISTPLRITRSTGAIQFNGAYTFPIIDGSANYVLQTNGSGTVSWADVSDATTLNGVSDTQFLRSDTSDAFTSGTLTFNAGTTVAFSNTTGTSPFTVVSTTLVSNLNADMLDGNEASAFLLASNNLSDVTASTARTNLGLVAGGTGDIWVEKAGDSMTGNLSIVNDSGGVTDTLLLVESAIVGHIGNVFEVNSNLTGSTAFNLITATTGTDSDSTGPQTVFNVRGDGNVTIGIKGSSGATASTVFDNLVIDSSVSAGISILTPNGASGHIAFGDPDDNDVGRFSYAHSTNILNIIAGAVSTIGVRAGQVVVAPSSAATGTALGLLHARSASSGVGSVNSGADDIVIENSTTGGLSILTPNTNQGRIAFGDPENNIAAIFSYDHSVDRYYFDINSSSKTTIDTTRVIINPGASGGTPSGNGLVIESDTNSILNILSPNTNYGSIFFGDPESSTAGYMQYLHSSNSFVLGSSGIDRVTIDSSGQVGIGTSNPSGSLHISNTFPTIYLTDTDTGVDARISAGSGAGQLFIDADLNNENSSSAMVFGVAGSEVARFTNSGTFSVGTTSGLVSELIHARRSSGTISTLYNSGSTGDVLRLYHENTAVTAFSIWGQGVQRGFITSPVSSDGLIFGTSSTERMRIDSSGRVGIGITPSTTLEVNGVTTFSSSGTTRGKIDYDGGDNVLRMQTTASAGGGIDFTINGSGLGRNVKLAPTLSRFYTDVRIDGTLTATTAAVTDLTVSGLTTIAQAGENAEGNAANATGDVILQATGAPVLRPTLTGDVTLLVAGAPTPGHGWQVEVRPTQDGTGGRAVTILPANLWTYSNAIDDAAWTKARATTSTGAGVAPDGQTTAVKLVEDGTAANTHLVHRTITKAASALTYTFEGTFERDGRHVVMNFHDGTGSNGVGVSVNLTTGELVNPAPFGSGFAIIAQDISAEATGGYSVVLTFSTNTTTSLRSNFFLADDTFAITFNGNATSGVIMSWLNLVEGSVALGRQVVGATRAGQVVWRTAADEIDFAAQAAGATSRFTAEYESDGIISLRRKEGAIDELTPTDGNVIVGNGTTWVAESGSTARASLGFTDPILDRGAPQTINQQTGTTYTPVLTDAGKIVECSNASAITVTIPPNSDVAYAVGAQLTVVQTGAGTVTLAPGSGVTLSSRGALLSSAGQYGVVWLYKQATNVWVVTGDLA